MTPTKRTCIYCGRRLAPQFRRESHQIRVPDTAISNTILIDGRPVRMLANCEGTRTVYGPKHLAGYGYKGNGWFCSLRCGFQYALRKLSEEVTQ